MMDQTDINQNNGDGTPPTDDASGGRGTVSPADDATTRDLDKGARQGKLLQAQDIGRKIPWDAQINEGSAKDDSELYPLGETPATSLTDNYDAASPPDIWFTLANMMMPDGSRIKVAMDISDQPPE